MSTDQHLALIAKHRLTAVKGSYTTVDKPLIAVRSKKPSFKEVLNKAIKELQCPK